MSESLWSAEIPGREQISLAKEVLGNGSISLTISGIGGPQFLETLVQIRALVQAELSESAFLSLSPPAGTSVCHLLFREVLLRAQGRWEYPYGEEELCHCRAVPTLTVDRAILVGGHSPEEVSRLTGASTACGTCRSDVKAILAFRLGS